VPQVFLLNGPGIVLLFTARQSPYIPSDNLDMRVCLIRRHAVLKQKTEVHPLEGRLRVNWLRIFQNQNASRLYFAGSFIIRPLSLI
jgi:hypothetical protein